MLIFTIEYLFVSDELPDNLI